MSIRADNTDRKLIKKRSLLKVKKKNDYNI